jgi:hypothetical protein
MAKEIPAWAVRSRLKHPETSQHTITLRTRLVCIQDFVNGLDDR